MAGQEDRTELERLLHRAVEKYNAMTDDEKRKMLNEQRDGYVKAEMSWPEGRYVIVEGIRMYLSYEDYCNS